MKPTNLWRRRLTVATLATSLIMPVARGQDTTSAVVATNASLDALVTEALEKNPELKFYEAEIVAAKGSRKTAGTACSCSAGRSWIESVRRG